MSALDEMQVDLPETRDKPMDWVADCAHPFCKKPIHFKERCVKVGEDHYCSYRCFIDWNNGQVVEAGTDTLTI
jgi:hypothetical protein